MNLTTAQERLTSLQNLKGTDGYDRAFRDFTDELNSLTPGDYKANDADQEAIVKHFKGPTGLAEMNWDDLPNAAKAVLIMRSAVSTYRLPLVTDQEFQEFSRKYQQLIVRSTPVRQTA